MKQLVLLSLFFCLCISCAWHSDSIDREAFMHTGRGNASYYADKYQYRTTANGEIFDNAAMTAAHRTLPFGTRVLVTNIRNGKQVEVVVNDRGPFVRGRVIDLTQAAFARIEDVQRGVAEVDLAVLR